MCFPPVWYLSELAGKANKKAMGHQIIRNAEHNPFLQI